MITASNVCPHCGELYSTHQSGCKIMTNKPNTDKTIEMIRDELVANYDPTHDIEMAIKVKDIDGIYDCVVGAYKAGFDAAIKLSEEKLQEMFIAFESKEMTKLKKRERDLVKELIAVLNDAKEIIYSHAMQTNSKSSYKLGNQIDELIKKHRGENE